MTADGSTMVTVGIPAYNEEANIARLLRQVLCQEQRGFVLERILVISDGSSDTTCNEVREVLDERIDLRCEPHRQGRAARHDQLLRLCQSDVFISLDADIVLPNNHTLHDLVRPVAAGEADLVACRLEALPPRSALQRVLWSGLSLRNRVAERYRQGDNVYACHGPARAFSRRLYEAYSFSDGVAEDAYSYLYVKSCGLRYRFLPETSVVTQLPLTLRDHLNQSARFHQNQAEMRRYFPSDFVQEVFRLPRRLSLAGMAAELRQTPACTLAYMVLISLSTLLASKAPSRSRLWQMATTTKRLAPVEP